MRLSLSRSFGPDKLSWLADLDERVQINRKHAWGYEREEVLPIEDDFIDCSRQNFSNAIEYMRRGGWIWLGKIRSIEEINWLVQQDSWCIVDIPFTDEKQALTKDKLSSIKYKLKFKSFISNTELDGYIVEYKWTAVPITWQASVVDIENWCKSYCSDVYFFHTVNNKDSTWTMGPTQLRQLVFMNANDAIRFKLSGFGVEE